MRANDKGEETPLLLTHGNLISSPEHWEMYEVGKIADKPYYSRGTLTRVLQHLDAQLWVIRIDGPFYITTEVTGLNTSAVKFVWRIKARSKRRNQSGRYQTITTRYVDEDDIQQIERLIEAFLPIREPNKSQA